MTYGIVENGVIVAGPLAEQSTIIKKMLHTGNPECLPLADKLAAGILPWEYADLSPTQKHGEPVIDGQRIFVPAIDKSADELASELEQHIDAMDSACRAWVDRHAHWTGGIKSLQKAQAGKPKAIAVFAWAEAVWGLFYSRCDQLRAGTLAWSDELLTFPPCPHTMREVAEE